MFDPEKPYNDLPLLPPKSEIETITILKKCIEASRELASLKEAGKLIPNQTVLINCIPLLESQASSAIENIVTTTDELFEHADDGKDGNISQATKETLRYRQALYNGILSLKHRPLNISIVNEICSTIKLVEMTPRKLPGTALINDKTGKKIYTPPEGEIVLQRLLTNWQQYLHADDQIDPLIKLAIQHYQFEAIHPYSDGNGRTGRIINLLYLVEKGLLEIPVLYLSGYIIDNKTKYYTGLMNITLKGAWEEWILFFLDAVKETSIWTKEKIISIQELFTNFCTDIKKELPSIYSYELVEILFQQPYVRITNLIDAGIAKRDTASKYLKLLSDSGFLQEIHRGRDKIFVNHQFLQLLKKR